jgi:hypothetical protein
MGPGFPFLRGYGGEATSLVRIPEIDEFSLIDAMDFVKASIWRHSLPSSSAHQ